MFFIRRFDMSIYTDLACEARELNPDIEGVSEALERDGEIEIKRISISTSEAAQRLNKRMGSYVTIDAPGLIYRPFELFQKVSLDIAKELDALTAEITGPSNIMIVGLGNRNVTPDSLGPRTVERIFVTRHVINYMPEAFDFPIHSVSAIAPGVLGSTGIETYELIRGLIENTGPDIIIAVDSLASRRAARISTTVQLSDAGIDPGSGVGNIRAGLNRESLNIPVIAIGVPLVVYASTITRDVISMISGEPDIGMSAVKLTELAEKAISERMDDMIVTPKDIDSIIDDMSGIVAEGVNRAIYKERYDQVKSLIT